MAKIKPFRGVFYNSQKIPELWRVVCPPYDVINARQQEFYHSLSPYNIIQLILGKDIPQQDKYLKAKEYFHKWLQDKILIQDDSYSIYFYLQEYKIKGEKRSRFGFIALLNLAESNSIFSHEHTRIEPKEDRLRLLEAVKANLSPIFVLFRDKLRIIMRIYEEYLKDKKPFMELTDTEGIYHKLWRIDEPYYLNLFQEALKDREIFIADGHHRYEVALNYRQRMREKEKLDSKEEKSFDYIMAYFTPIESRGLLILPIHRLIRGTDISLETLKEKVEKYFSLEEIKDKNQFFFFLEKAGLSQPTLGLYINQHYFILRLKNIAILDKIMQDKPRAYRRLDAAILNSFILEDALNIDTQDKKKVVFGVEPDELIMQADKEENSFVFFLNPVKIEDMLNIACEGHRLPPKSTYFYPKVLSGLIINKHE